MVKKEEWVLIRGLASKIKSGMSVTAIAEQTGHDRKTIRKYLLAEGEPRYTLIKQPSKLYSYQDYITSRLKEVPEITVKRVLREIKERGYGGGYTILKDFVYPLREKAGQEAVMRFETLPGEQSQVDWSYFGIIEEYGIKRRLSCFSMVLGFSRTLWVEFTTSQDILTFLSCHQNAFLYFGGYTRTILYDNPKTVVISRCGSNIAWNEKFMDFAGFYGFTPRLCRLYRAQTKGKIERPFDYIYKDFFIGTKFEGLDDLNRKAKDWLNNIANTRIHGTTKEVPFERLKKEKESLLLLKDRLYDTSCVEPRKASSDCFISYEGNRYSVPYQYRRRNLTIRADKERIKIYADNPQEPVAIHSLFKGKGKDISDPKHFEGIVIKQRERWDGLKLSFVSLCPSAKDYWDGFLASPRMRGKWWELRKIISLCEKYSPQDVDYAFSRALKFGAFGHKYLVGILDGLRKERAGGVQPVSEILKDVLSRFEIPKVEERPLESYEKFLNQ